jgi:hypothetical protein
MTLDRKLTRQAAQALGVSAAALRALLERSRIAPPEKDAAGNYWWSPQDISAARLALATDLRRRENRDLRGRAQVPA